MGSKNGGPDQRRGDGSEGGRRWQSCRQREGTWRQGEECLRLNWAFGGFGEAFSGRPAILIAVSNDSDETYRRRRNDSNEEGATTRPTVANVASSPRSVGQHRNSKECHSRRSKQKRPTRSSFTGSKNIRHRCTRTGRGGDREHQHRDHRWSTSKASTKERDQPGLL